MNSSMRFLALALPLTLTSTLVASYGCGSSDAGNVTDQGGSTDPSGTGADAASGDGSTTGYPDGSSSDDSSSPGDASGATGIKTVFVIMMENHSWSTIKNAGANAAYINGTLIPMGAHAEAYTTPPGNHPSEPNYVWLEAGDNLGITTDDPPSTNHQSTKDHLTSQLDAKKIPWKAYAEGASGTACPLTATGLYDPKHTPQLFFDDVTNTNQASSAYCIAHVRPYAEFAADLGSGKAGRYNFITPNLCNDMHGNGFSGACSFLAPDSSHIKLGNDWLAAEVPKILASPAYQDHGVIFVLWDEGDAPAVGNSSDGPMGMLAISPLAKKNFSTSTPFTHSSLLRTVEAIFGLPYLRGAQTATPLAEMFTTFP